MRLTLAKFHFMKLKSNTRKEELADDVSGVHVFYNCLFVLEL